MPKCTIIGGDYSDDTTPRKPTVLLEGTDEAVGVITDTRIERGSSSLINDVQTLRIDGGRITDGDGNKNRHGHRHSQQSLNF